MPTCLIANLLSVIANNSSRHCERSAAIHAGMKSWIATAFGLAMTKGRGLSMAKGQGLAMTKWQGLTLTKAAS